MDSNPSTTSVLSEDSETTEARYGLLVGCAPQFYSEARHRAGFQDVLPVSDGSRLLMVGPCELEVAAEIGSRHTVTVLQPDLVKSCTDVTAAGGCPIEVILGDLDSRQFGCRTFDVIVMNGSLGHAATWQVRARWLSNASSLLREGGFLFVAVRNRLDWNQARVLLRAPRTARRLFCAPGAGTIYRYKRLFKSVRLQITEQWIMPFGYELPIEMVPVNRHAIDAYARRLLLNPPIGIRQMAANQIKLAVSRSILWQIIGGDFSFLLRRQDA